VEHIYLVSCVIDALFLSFDILLFLYYVRSDRHTCVVGCKKIKNIRLLCVGCFEYTFHSFWL
jgi:hypothetical protein